MRVPDATPRRILAGVSAQTFARFSQTAAAFGTVAALARLTPLATLGHFAVYLGLFQLAEVVIDFGSSLSFVRRAAAEPSRARAELRGAIRFRMVSAPLVAGLLAAVVLLDSSLRPFGPWMLLATPLLLAHVVGCWGALFELRLAFGKPSLFKAATALGGLAFTLFAALQGIVDPGFYVFLAVAAQAVYNLLLFLAARPLLADYPVTTGETVGYRREALLLGAGAVCRDLYGRLDLFLLRVLISPAAAGLYEPARRMLNVALHLPNYAMRVAMPALARRAGEAPSTLPATTWRIARRLALFAFPSALISLPLAAPVLHALFGEAFADSAPALRVLAFAAAAAYVGMAFLVSLIAAGHARAALLLSALGLGVASIAALLLIPQFGTVGAASTRLLVELLVAGGGMVLLRASVRAEHPTG